VFEPDDEMICHSNIQQEQQLYLHSA
jgi:hypothetical protein